MDTGSRGSNGGQLEWNMINGMACRNTNQFLVCVDVLSLKSSLALVTSNTRSPNNLPRTT